MRTRLFHPLIVIAAFVIFGTGCSNKAPSACYSISSTNDTVNQVVSFNSGCTTGGSFYYWDFGDGSPASKLPNPTHAYSAQGIYSVTFWASNKVGSTKGDVMNITVTNWKSSASGTSENLTSVYFPFTDTGYVVGTNGTILRTVDAGLKWTSQTSTVTSNNLSCVYFLSDKLGYIVGDKGTILTTSNAGVTWTALSSNSTVNLSSVDFTTSKIGYAVGANGTLLTTTNAGSSWSSQTLVTANLNCVYFTGIATGYIVGAGGTILETSDSGKIWNVVTSNTTENLTSMCYKNGYGFIVGGIGTGTGIILENSFSSGTTWTITSSGINANLAGVACRGSEYFTCGYGGAMLQANASGSWSGMITGTNNYLLSVCMVSDNTGYAVGENGTILKF
jgi:photosystem II stability/assembly factor-like uncharacterized protein